MSEPTDIVSRMRLLEDDHEPDGWPAVQMCEITALCNMIEEVRDRLEDGIVSCHEGKDGYALVDKAQLAQLVGENARLKEQVRVADAALATATVALVDAVLGPVSQPALMDVAATLP